MAVLGLGQHDAGPGARAGDDADTDDFAERLGGGASGLGGGLDGGDIAGDANRDHGVADLGHRSDDFHVGGFEHGVGRLDEGDEAACFDHS